MESLRQDRHVVLDEGEADRIISNLPNAYPSTCLVSPTKLIRDGERGTIAIMFPAQHADRQDSGTVFFTHPTQIDTTGVELRFSFQCGGYPEQDEGAEAELAFGTERLDGNVELAAGQCYVRAVGDGYPLADGMEMALFVQAWPYTPDDEPDTE